MAKVFTIPVLPDPKRRQRERKRDARYVQGQRLIADAMKYLTKSDKHGNKPAIDLLFEHFQSNFRSSDSPLTV